MCLLCLASRWSRRIVAMLPWLIIPLIILWALSQLLPSNFQFEVTSPKLACVGVLLVSLGWYELAIPQLTVWRSKRSYMLQERRRLEALEAAKLRKLATRLCRNCSSPYRFQTPVGGKFVCTFCGHVSRRPVLDVPPGTANVAGSAETCSESDSAVTRQSWSGSGNRLDKRVVHLGDSRGGLWGFIGWLYSLKFSALGVIRGWKAREGAPMGHSLSMEVSYWCALCPQGDAERSNDNSTRLLDNETCRRYSSFPFLTLRMLFILIVRLRSLFQKAWYEASGRAKSSVSGRAGSQHLREGANCRKWSRSEKARRKAEEKRQARITKEQIEADENRQREEVARLVEERRRLRDEALEAERVTKWGVATDRDSEFHWDGVGKHCHQAKCVEKDTLNGRLILPDLVDDTNCVVKEERQKRDVRGKNSHGRKSNEVGKKLGVRRSLVTAKEIAKSASKSDRADHNARGTDMNNAGSSKVGRCSGTLPFPVATDTKMQNMIATPTWNKSSAVALSPAKTSRSSGNSVVENNGNLCKNILSSSGHHLDRGLRAWNNIRWRNVWGRVASTSSLEECDAPPAPSNNLNLKSTSCSDFLKEENWFEGNSYLESKNSADLGDDLITQSGVSPLQTFPRQSLREKNYVAPIGPQQVNCTPPSRVLNSTHSVSGEAASPGIMGSWVDVLKGRSQSALVPEDYAADDAVENGNWKMWESPQLDHIQLSCSENSSSSLAWMLPPGLFSDLGNSSCMGVSAQLEPQLPNCFFPSQPGYSCSNCPATLPSNTPSLWSSDPSFIFGSTTPQQAAGVAGCISEIVMEEPMKITDDCFFKHSSILREPQIYDSSTTSGECVAPYSTTLPSNTPSLWTGEPSFVFRSTTSQQAAGVTGFVSENVMEEHMNITDDCFYEHSSILRELHGQSF
ncbi:uncharacterized protein [Physcomitrium patens]|uniref:uncharacterized protein isoform X2 n=1 Tax=Physcomitrium patens TaxID=3218 RepID=UPI000D166321|nr:uncharacterized protein LOC112289221 isoform X3 [Physcomitrium patens]|eukprot:XP_024390028.1 uncharacterized protein LOC112289221 isoform X3 [Physcomitrella patens]